MAFRVAAAARLHGLFLLELKSGAIDQAEAHARNALPEYGPSHRRLPEMMHEMARLWLTLERW